MYFVNISLRHRHALIVGDCVFSHVTIFYEILNLEEHPNCITGATGNFAEWVDFYYWWSFSGGGSAISGATPSS